jgi:phage terminase large subunit
MVIKYNPAFSGFFANKKRYAILMGGAGSGKSWAIGQYIVESCLKERERWLIIRKYKTTIKNSVFRLIADLIRDYKIESFCDINKSDMFFQIGDSDIITSGLDDPEKIKSIQGITKVWIEEATELEELDFDQLDLRLRGGEVDKQIICSFNPISEDHWLKKKFFDNQTEDVYLLHTTYKDNYFLDNAYRKLLEERMSVDENMYRIYVKGIWGRVTTGQEWHKNFSRAVHVNDCKFLQGYPIHVSFDFNVNPYMPCSIWQIIPQEQNGKKIYHANCIDEIALKNPLNKTSELCKEVARVYGDSVKKMYIYGDASGKRRATESQEHNYDVIKRVLRRWVDDQSMRVPARNPDLTIRKDFTNMILAGAFPIVLRINEKCNLMITDLESVLEDTDHTKKAKMVRDPLSDIVMQKYGHFSDTFDYFLTQAFNYYYNEIHRFIGKSGRGGQTPKLQEDDRLSQPVY